MYIPEEPKSIRAGLRTESSENFSSFVSNLFERFSKVCRFLGGGCCSTTVALAAASAFFCSRTYAFCCDLSILCRSNCLSVFFLAAASLMLMREISASDAVIYWNLVIVALRVVFGSSLGLLSSVIGQDQCCLDIWI